MASLSEPPACPLGHERCEIPEICSSADWLKSGRHQATATLTLFEAEKTRTQHQRPVIPDGLKEKVLKAFRAGGSLLPFLVLLTSG